MRAPKRSHSHLWQLLLTLAGEFYAEDLAESSRGSPVTSKGEEDVPTRGELLF